MEQNLPVLAKKVWRLVRAVYYMLRKGISSKTKLFLDLNMLIKRGKITAKTSSLPSEYKKRRYPTNKPPVEDPDMMVAVMKAMEMNHSETKASSPALPGFGRTPVVRQLRVTDSPFPLSSVDDRDSHVDEAAEEFISRFYHDLRRQNTKAAFGSS